MGKIIRALYRRRAITKTDRQGVYGVLIPVFIAEGCDTLHECLGLDPAFDAAYRRCDPGHFALVRGDA